jgi:hypothetical protein
MHTRSIILALVLGLASVAAAMEPAELVDAKLERQAIQFVTLSGGELSYFNAQRQLQRVIASKFVSLQFPGRTAAAAQARRENAAAAKAQSLVLRDGHVLTGSFGGAEADQLIWVSRSLGPVRVELDQITRVAVMSDAPVPPADMPADASDKVLLANGDHLAGFIESIDAAGLVLMAGEQRLNLAWDRVARLVLPNPIVPTPGVWVKLTDGTRLRVENVVFDGTKLSGRMMGKDVELEAGMVSSVEFATDHRLVPIADLETASISGGQVFGVPMGPAFDGDEARLHAPVTVELNLPAGATRFAATASLDEADLDWADLTLTIADGKGELLKQRLNRDKPSIDVNLAPRGARLTITLDEGINGPIRDRLKLTNAAVLADTE